MTTQPEFKMTGIEWREQVRPLVLKHFAGKDGFTADDLHGIVPEPRHYNAYGALFKAMSRAKLIEQVDAIPSQRPERNGSLIRVWRVK